MKFEITEDWAGYGSFEACVKANQDRKYPAAYCVIMKMEKEQEINNARL